MAVCIKYQWVAQWAYRCAHRLLGCSNVGKGNATSTKRTPVDNVPAVREDVNALETGHLPRGFDGIVEPSGRKAQYAGRYEGFEVEHHCR